MTTRPRLSTVVLDTARVAELSRFWAQLLGGTVEVEDDTWHWVRLPGQVDLGVQHSSGHVPPQWPDGLPQQLHLDLDVDDIAAAHRRAVAMGATVLRPEGGPDVTAAAGFQVYADPAGHPFCLCWG